MKSVKEAAKDFSLCALMDYEAEEELNGEVDIEEFSSECFKRGVEFAQRWISVEEELPLCFEYGNWDGLRSEFVLAKDNTGEWHKARLYSGLLDVFKFNQWVDSRDYDLIGIIEWRQIELK